MDYEYYIRLGLKKNNFYYLNRCLSGFIYHPAAKSVRDKEKFFKEKMMVLSNYNGKININNFFILNKLFHIKRLFRKILNGGFFEQIFVNMKRLLNK